MRKYLLSGVLAVFLSMFFFLTSLAQDRVINGTVRDDKQAPLAGATVTVKETKAMTTTDASGQFSIRVGANGKTLIISFVGMESREVALGSSNTVNAQLAPVGTTMTDVVVVGYGRARRANLTTAQVSVGAKEIEKTVNTTLEQALQGRAAGVYITQNSGQPGGGISVAIRGVSSINGNTEPLYVIDGVQLYGGGTANSSNPLAGLNPNDIEDMQILQGPSATAIYGSRASNGVILITTKRGKSGDFKINYNAQYNVQTPPRRVEVMNLPQYAQMQKEYKAIAGGTVRDELLDPSILGPGTDWQDELFNNAAMQKHQLSFSGGNNNTTYYMSGEYLDQAGVAEGSGFKRYGFRLNLDNKPKDWLTLGANLSFNQTNERLTTSQENVIIRAIQLSPEVPVRNLDGSWGGGDRSNDAHRYSPVNPVAISQLVTNKNTRRQFMGGLNIGFNLAKGLVARTSFNTTLGYGDAINFIPVYKIGWAENDQATFSNTRSQSTYWNWNQLVEYNKQIKKHNVTLMASHESQASEWANVGGRRIGYYTNDIFDLNPGSTDGASNSGGSDDWGMESYLGRLNYNYDNRYLVTATYRRDGSVYFGADKRWGSFPSVSLAWRVNNESFFNIPFISDLKLRLEKGLTGNPGWDKSAIYSVLNAGATQFGTSFLVRAYPNPGFQWEETNTNNIGLNIGLLKNRFTADFDYYVKRADNLIMSAAFPWYMGTVGQGAINPPMVNAGDLQTNGWSFNLNTTNIDKKNFRWSSNLNLSHFETEIKRLNSENAFFDRQSWWLNQPDPWTQRSTVGMAPWLFRGYIVEGIFQSVEEIEKSPVPVDNDGNRRPTKASGGIWVGDYKYKDVNGDKKITDADKTFIGNPWPKLFGGFTNNFSYKGFDLSVLITATYGNDIYNFVAWENSNPNNINLGRNMMLTAMDYAKVATDGNGKAYLLNPDTKVPRIIPGADVNSTYTRITDNFVEDGSYIRLKNVTLGYNLPESILGRVKAIKSLRATVGVQNLATLTNYTGFDPEVGAYVGRDASSTNQAIGLDYGRYPLTPIYTFGLNVNF